MKTPSPPIAEMPPPRRDALLSERTRLQRLLKTHQDRYRKLLAEPSFFTVIDSYPIDLLFPIRQGRNPQQVARKARTKDALCVGIKLLCWLFNDQGQVVEWDWDTMNVHDQHFHHVIERVNEQNIVLADSGFRSVDGILDNCELCAKGTWNERMRVETALSMVTVVCDLKRIHHRLRRYIQARLASVVAMFNVLLTLFHQQYPDADPFKMSIAEFSL